MSGYGGVDDDQINAQAFTDNYIALARSLLPTGKSAKYCIECGDEIPLARREALLGVKHCIYCQLERDKHRPSIKVVTKML
jgi:phage/conjugal plasmid C-4 type zinc finger TraR family protein